jgi:two-component system phosphate regulon sensor histidine kinase PhoR
MRQHIINSEFEEVDILAKKLGRDSSTRITVILPRGKVIADTYNDPKTMDNHINRLEIKDAVSSGAGTSIRYSDTMKTKMLYAVYLLTDNNRSIAFIRTSVTAETISKTLIDIYLQLLIGVSLLIVLIIIISLYISRRISRSLVAMKLQTQKISEGDFSLKLTLKDTDPIEIQEIGIAIENMTEELKKRMIRLKHLERHRKEFVANVSHELKTPITSIKGFVETLTDNRNLPKEEIDKFLNIILRQSNRLNSIIDDLLSLSELERFSETLSGLQFERATVKYVIESAVAICNERAKDMDIKISIECEESINGLLNSHLLEQAIVNLIDNAIKYSQGSGVTISSYMKDNNVIIKVSDNGIGIESEHLSRIFERFYRIDKGRSRKVGGTGLGLSIVKHIAEVHGGVASVESDIGKGSIFSISIKTGE